MLINSEVKNRAQAIRYRLGVSIRDAIKMACDDIEVDASVAGAYAHLPSIAFPGL